MSKFVELIPSSSVSQEYVEKMKEKLGISDILVRLLLNRDITSIDQAEKFLNPSFEYLHNPYKLADMDKAVNRINKAVLEGQKITIYGDYDVDGITSSTLLYLVLKQRQAKVEVYIPNRHEEGYGLNDNAVKILKERNTELMITVDCGITAINEVKLANELGMDVIVTDHHQCGAQLPDAYAIINPTRSDQDYPFKELAGVGVAVKLVHALGGLEPVKMHIDLIALGTIADVVPLVDENRIFVFHGLKKINNDPSIGLQALIKAAGYEDKTINTGSVAFGLAPRLNAAGRISTAQMGFKLLSSYNWEEAYEIAHELDRENKMRQSIENDLLNDVKQMMKLQVDLSRDKIIIVQGEGWHPGVIGIAASKVTDYYNRPCILISVSDGVGTASARSIKGFHLFQALSSFKSLFLKFGGHEQAAGFSIREDNIPEFRSKFLKYAAEHIKEEQLVPCYKYDALLNPDQISLEQIAEFEMLSPFGVGNPVPNFRLKDAIVYNCRNVGKNKEHLKLNIRLGTDKWEAIAFGLGTYSNYLTNSEKMDILARLEKNEWAGVTRIQFQITNMKKNLNNEQNLEDFLCSLDCKFFDAFLPKIMYNNYDRYSGNPNFCSYSSLRCISKNSFENLMGSTAIGHLILTHTPEGSRRILRFLYHNNLISRIVVDCGSLQRQDDVGINALIIFPDYDEISFSRYLNIYILEDELPFFSLAKCHGDYPEGKTYIIKTDVISDKESVWKNEFNLERDHLVTLYKWIRSIAREGWLNSNWKDAISDFNLTNSKTIDNFRFRMAMEIFKELNFLEMTSSNDYFKLRLINNPASRKLNDSILFRICQRISKQRKILYNMKED